MYLILLGLLIFVFVQIVEKYTKSNVDIHTFNQVFHGNAITS